MAASLRRPDKAITGVEGSDAIIDLCQCRPLVAGHGPAGPSGLGNGDPELICRAARGNAESGHPIRNLSAK